MSRHAIPAIIYLSFIFLGCNKPDGKKEDPPPPGEGTYFSIRQFAKDQYELFKGQPFTFDRFETINGKRDSTLVNTFQVDWAEILKIFFATDISDPEYLGKYDFSLIDDDATISRIYYYEANDPALFTRKLQIITDPENNKIKSIYIETRDEKGVGERAQKLYYAPKKVIQIQEFESKLAGPDRNYMLEYRFLY